MRFCVGDYVMVAAWGNAAHVQRSSKLTPVWQGPYEVVDAPSTTAYAVRLVGRPNKQAKTVHWTRIKRFGDASLNLTDRLTRTAVNDCQKFDVHEFVDWREEDDGNIMLKVRWEGFQPEDDTWQSLAGLFEDVPVLVRKFLASRSGESEVH